MTLHQPINVSRSRRTRVCAALLALAVVAGVSLSAVPVRAAGCGDRHYADASQRTDAVSLSWLQPASSLIGPFGRIDDGDLPWSPSPCTGLRCSGDPATLPVGPLLAVDMHRLDPGMSLANLDRARQLAGDWIVLQSSSLPELHLASRLDRPPR